MSEKEEVKALQDEEIGDVSGGYVNWIGNVCCDICRKKIGSTGGLPFNGGKVYYCADCLKKTKDTIGPNAMAEWVKRNT